MSGAHDRPPYRWRAARRAGIIAVMHRFRSRRFFYISLLGWTAAFGLVFDYLVATVPGAGEPWFYSFGIMIYSLALFVMTVLHFDQSGQL